MPITIPMLQATQQDMINRVRIECGSPLVDELSDATILQKLNQVASKRIAPGLGAAATKLTYLTTVADLQYYTPISTASEVVDVYWRGSGVGFPYQFDVDFPAIVPEQFSEAYEFRSLSIIFEQKMKALHDDYTYGPGYDLIDGKIYLDPTPTVAGEKVYYLYVEDKTVADVMNNFPDLLVEGATEECLRILAMIRSNIGVIGREGLEAYKTIQYLLAEATRRGKKFDDELLAAQNAL